MISFTLTKDDGKFSFKEGINNDALNFALLELAKKEDNYLDDCYLVAVNSNKYVHGVGKYKDVIFGDKFNVFVIPENTNVKFVGITGSSISFLIKNGVIEKLED